MSDRIRGLDDTYKTHFHVVAKRHAHALEVTGYRSVLIYSGFPHALFEDDQANAAPETAFASPVVLQAVVWYGFSGAAVFTPKPSPRLAAPQLSSRPF